jgi:hypothetical protein
LDLAEKREGDSAVKNRAKIINAAAMGMGALVLASCFHTQAMVTPPANFATEAEGTVDNPTWGQATVTGQPAHLVTFDASFRQNVGTTNLEAQQIGCIEGCDQLGNSTLVRLVYVFPREYPNILAHFSQAWDTTQKSSGDGDFMLQLDGAVTNPDCTGPTNPAPCEYMPFCAVDHCGRKVSGVPNCTIC